MHFKDCQAARAAGGAPNMFAATKLPCPVLARWQGPSVTRLWLSRVVDVVGAVKPACFVAPSIVRRPCDVMRCPQAASLSRARVTSRYIQRRSMQQHTINRAVRPLSLFCSSSAIV